MQWDLHQWHRTGRCNILGHQQDLASHEACIVENNKVGRWGDRQRGSHLYNPRHHPVERRTTSHIQAKVCHSSFAHETNQITREQDASLSMQISASECNANRPRQSDLCQCLTGSEIHLQLLRPSVQRRHFGALDRKWHRGWDGGKYWPIE